MLNDGCRRIRGHRCSRKNLLLQAAKESGTDYGGIGGPQSRASTFNAYKQSLDRENLEILRFATPAEAKFGSRGLPLAPPPLLMYMYISDVLIPP